MIFTDLSTKNIDLKLQYGLLIISKLKSGDAQLDFNMYAGDEKFGTQQQNLHINVFHLRALFGIGVRDDETLSKATLCFLSYTKIIFIFI